MRHSTRIALYLGSYAGVFIGTGVFIVGLGFAGMAWGCSMQSKREGE